MKTMEGHVKTATLLCLRQGSAPLSSGELLKYILARICAKIFQLIFAKFNHNNPDSALPLIPLNCSLVGSKRLQFQVDNSWLWALLDKKGSKPDSGNLVVEHVHPNQGCISAVQSTTYYKKERFKYTLYWTIVAKDCND